MGQTGKVPSESVKLYWVGSIPTWPTIMISSNRMSYFELNGSAQIS